MRLKETEADIAVRDRLWDATLREVSRFAEKYAAAHAPGEPYSEPQRDVCWCAKKAGYPIYLVRAVGDAILRGAPCDAPPAVAAYRERIGI